MVKMAVLLVAAAMGALLFSGCGGLTSGLSLSGNGELKSGDFVFSEGQYVDLLPVTAKRDGYVVVEMDQATSGSLNDPAVRAVYDRCTTPEAYNASFSANGYLAEDDDSGGGVNARAVFYVYKDQVFTVAFTSFEPGDIGHYHWNIYESDSSAMVRSIDQHAATNKTPRPIVKDGELIVQ